MNQWILCESMSPREGDEVLLTFKNEAGIHVGEATFKKGTYLYVAETSLGLFREPYTNPIAWMEKPKPFASITLKEFLERFICKNTLIRLWKPVMSEHNTRVGNQMIVENSKEVCMEWELLNGSAPQSKYLNCDFIGVTDIVTLTDREAVNIVIKVEQESNNCSEMVCPESNSESNKWICPICNDINTADDSEIKESIVHCSNCENYTYTSELTFMKWGNK